MENLKVYLSIEDPTTRQDVNISGRFDLLCAFLAGLNNAIQNQDNQKAIDISSLVSTNQQPVESVTAN